MALRRLTIVLLLLCMAHASTEDLYESRWGLESDRYCADRDEVTGRCSEGDGAPSSEEEVYRRILYAPGERYISYGALKKDMVPCNQRGQSYYNCVKRTRANPYVRRCTVITRCARILR